MAGVDALEHDHARVPAEGLVELAPAHVHGIDACRPALEQRLREASGRGSDVEGDPAARIDAKRVQRALELDRAAAHVLGAREHVHRRIRAHGGAGLGRGLAVDAYAAGHDQGLRLLPRRSQSTLDQDDVEPNRRQ